MGLDCSPDLAHTLNPGVELHVSHDLLMCCDISPEKWKLSCVGVLSYPVDTTLTPSPPSPTAKPCCRVWACGGWRLCCCLALCVTKQGHCCALLSLSFCVFIYMSYALLFQYILCSIFSGCEMEGYNPVITSPTKYISRNVTMSQSPFSSSVFRMYITRCVYFLHCAEGISSS